MGMVGFGGGCHWCTEAVFQSLTGVLDVRQGYIRSVTPDDDWSEAVEVTYDPDRITLSELIGVHLITHSSTSEHKLRGKYRSAVYVSDMDRLAACDEMIARIGQEADRHFVTRALVHCGFKPSDARFLNYYRTRPERPFCRTYIEPKLAVLRARLSTLLQAENLYP